MAESLAPLDVTCVIPTHGRDHLLVEAIASVVGQDRGPAALVISDDLGSAATRAVADEWAGRAPFPVTYADSSGPRAGTASASRNAGAALATTGLLAFLDDDDVWHPTYLTRLADTLESEGAGLVVAWNGASDPGYRIPRMSPGLTAADVVARNPGFVGSNFAIRSALFRDLGGFDESLSVSEDKDLLVRALLAGAVYAVVPEVLVTYRIHGSGQLTDKTDRRAQAISRYMRKHADLLSARDRRYLRAQIASVRRVTAPTAAGRLRSLGALVWDRAVLSVSGVAR